MNIDTVYNESLHAALKPLRLRQTFKSPSGRESIEIGDNIIPYHPNFKFYMITKFRCGNSRDQI